NAEGNLFYYNDFIDNFIQAMDKSPYGNNEWSRHVMAPESYIGNFWSDYDGVDVVAPSGVGDTPYNLTGTANVADLYPLMNPITVLPPPVLSSPADITILANTNGTVLVWEASTAVSPATMTISIDGVEVYSGVWDSAVITYSLDALALGNATSYSVTLIVYDSLGQSTSDTVIVKVEKSSSAAGSGLPIDPVSAGAGLVAGLAIFGAGSFIMGRRK
ncbi:MAG: NosD domain-containing protein, partial [Candidatus Hodarchaeales archaeon]